MIKTVYKVRFKKIVLAVLLASIAQWSYGGMVICYGADGHIEIEQPGAKDCCKKKEPVVSLDLITHFDLDHCVDIPIAAQKYIASTSYTAPVHNHIIAFCIVSPLLSSADRTLQRVNGRDIPPSYNPQLATLKTVVLLI
jgi:hypothetical protein